MRKAILPLCFSICCLSLFIVQGNAQNFQTWSIAAPSFATSNNNVLDASSLNLEMSSLEQLAEDADLQIDIQFIAELERNRLGQLQKKGGSFYRVLTTAPVFQATVTDASNQQLFQKTYGGNDLERHFGKNQSWTTEELSRNWNDTRNQFYQRLELMSLDVETLETDLNQLLGGNVVTSSKPTITSLAPEPVPARNTPPTVVEDVPEPQEYNNEIESTREEDYVLGTNNVEVENTLVEEEKLTSMVTLSKYRFGEHRGGITIGAGILPLEVSDGSISTFIRDESGSMDTFSSTIDVQDQTQALFFRIGLSGENIVKHRAWNINFDFGFGKEAVSKFEASLDYGFLIGKGRIRFAPQLSFVGGASNISLGKMYQNDTYIRIGDTDFYSESVNIKYKNLFLGGGPKLQVAISLAKNMDLKLHGSYIYGYSLGERLKFTGSDEENVPATARRTLPHSLVSYNIDNSDNVNIDRLFNFTGIKFGASLCF